MTDTKVIYVLHLKNGNVEPVEIDGEKYQANPDKPEEALLDDKGEKIPFKKEEAPAETDEQKTAREAKEKLTVDIGKMSIEEIAKSNPIVAEALKEGKTAKEALVKAGVDAKAAEEKEAEEKGEFKRLAEERATEIKILKSDATKKDEVLTKYKGSVEKILKEVESTIPDDKKTLIPEGFSPRQRLEYITQNATFLGAKTITNSGDGKTPKNEATPASTEEQKLAQEIDELQKKENKTPTELDTMSEKARQLKDLRAKNEK